MVIRYDHGWCTLLTLNSELRVRRARAIHAGGALGVRLLARGARRAGLVVSTDDIRLSTLLALTRDGVLSTGARLARSVVNVWTLARTATRAARSAFSNHIVTLLTLDSELRVRRAHANHTSGALRVWLLTRGACRACLMVSAHDTRLGTLLALTRDAVLSAGARLARSVVSVRALACTAT